MVVLLNLLDMELFVYLFNRSFVYLHLQPSLSNVCVSMYLITSIFSNGW